MTMTSTQFRAALDRLGIPQTGFAKLIHSDERTVRRWALGERAVPNTVSILLRLLVAGTLTSEQVEKAAGRA